MPDLTVLTQAGMDIDSLGAQEKEALNRLDQTEVEQLAAIRGKLNEPPEVSGHALRDGDFGSIIW
jgi:hypothetical protein